MDLELRVRDLEDRATRHSDQDRTLILKLAMDEMRQLRLGEAKLTWLATQHRVYEWGDKSGKLLSWLATP